MQYFCAYILLTIMTSVSKIQNVHLLADFEIITKSPKSNTICMSLSISYVDILFSINTRIDSTQNEILTIMHVKLTFFFSITPERRSYCLFILYENGTYKKYVHMLMHIRLRLTHQQKNLSESAFLIIVHVCHTCRY